jgi:hypothetical protein
MPARAPNIKPIGGALFAAFSRRLAPPIVICASVAAQLEYLLIHAMSEAPCVSQGKDVAGRQ